MKAPTAIRGLLLLGVALVTWAGCAGEDPCAAARCDPIVAPAPAPPHGPLDALGDPTPEAYRDALGVGLDVDWSKTGTGSDAYAPETVADFKARGLGHVRIRVKDDLSQTLVDGLDAQIGDCLREGLVPVVAYQADRFKNAPMSDADLDDAVAWWRVVAERYAAYPGALAFDLLIECSDALNDAPDRLNLYFERAVDAIRASSPTRMVMISPVVRSSPENLKLLAIPSRADGRLMAEWHFYAAGPTKAPGPKQWTTGTDAEKASITTAIDTAISWQNAHSIPTWVGAWMPGNYNDGDDYSVEEQVVFATFVACALRGAGVPYALNSDTKFYDPAAHVWLPARAPVLDAALAPTCP